MNDKTGEIPGDGPSPKTLLKSVLWTFIGAVIVTVLFVASGVWRRSDRAR